MLGKLVWSGHMHTVTHTHSNLPVNTKRSTVWKADLLEWVVGAKPCWDRDKYNLRRNRSYLLKTSLSPEIKKKLRWDGCVRNSSLWGQKERILEVFLRWLVVNVKEGSKRKINLLEKNKEGGRRKRGTEVKDTMISLQK